MRNAPYRITASLMVTVRSAKLAFPNTIPIAGMIKSFGSAANADASQKATKLAEGISEAMNCTAFGIATALVGLIGYAMLQGKTQVLTDDINEVTVQVVNLVTSHRQAMKPGAAA